jgi:hypothetical protein
MLQGSLVSLFCCCNSTSEAAPEGGGAFITGELLKSIVELRRKSNVIDFSAIIQYRVTYSDLLVTVADVYLTNARLNTKLRGLTSGGVIMHVWRRE